MSTARQEKLLADCEGSKSNYEETNTFLSGKKINMKNFFKLLLDKKGAEKAGNEIKCNGYESF